MHTSTGLGNLTRLSVGGEARHARQLRTFGRRRQQSCRRLCQASLQDDLEQILDKVRVRQSAMQRAVEAEDYKSAAAQRDSLDQLKLQKRRIELEIDRESRTVNYEIGMVIQHKRYNYRGVIVGFDDHCNAPDAWIRHMGVDRLPKGRRQPFYHVLVDTNDRPSGGRTFSTTYVAQENINVMDATVAVPVENELIEHNFDGFENGRYKPKSHLLKQYPAAGSSISNDDGGSSAEED